MDYKKEGKESIIVANSLEGVSSQNFVNYLVHAYCYKGLCRFTFNGNDYEMKAGDCLITRRSDMMCDFQWSDDFLVDVIYVTREFIEISTPQSNYGMKGQLALFDNPIMHLTEEQQKICALDFDFIKRRLAFDTHHFHNDAMRNAIECLIIDFFDFHATLYGKGEKVSSQYSLIMEQFQKLLERGDYRQNRKINYYAQKLCITPKYLSEISKLVSGFPANYWITRYTTLDISRKLRDRSKTLTELADMYGFSSLSYFTQYVQKHLGATPSEYRD